MLTGKIDLTAFKKRRPIIGDRSEDQILTAYETVTHLAPSLVMHPEVLYSAMEHMLVLGVLGVADALTLLDFEARTRARAVTSGNAEGRVTTFFAELKTLLGNRAILPREDLSDEGLRTICAFLEKAEHDLFPL